MAIATIAFVLGQFPVTTSTKVVGNGPVKVISKQQRIVEVPRAVDVVVFISGFAMVVFGARKA
jgi:hypothetical protein